MNYIYDVLANFNEKYYDFYEWNTKDEIVHIKRLPIIRVTRDFLNNIKQNDITVEKEILEKIYKKTELFKNKQKKYNHVCALCDGTKALIVKFEQNGRVLEKSSLLLDEENEIINISETMKTSEYKIKKIQKKNNEEFKTRREIDINEYIISKLNNIDDEKLKYLYYDCFAKKENDINIILENILNEIKNNFENIYIKIYDFLKLTSINK